MRTAKWRNLFATLTIIVALVGCGPSNEEKAAVIEEQTRAALRAKRAAAAAKAADPTATMARAVATGKTDAPIDLKYDILAKPIAGQAVEIELALIPTAPVDSISASIAGSSGLALSGELLPSFGAAKAGQSVRARVAVKADKEDVFYITVAATIHAAGVPSTRSYAIPILVSAPAQSAPPAPETAAASDAKKDTKKK